MVDFDLMVLKNVIGELFGQRKEGRAMLLGVSIHVETLSGAAGRDRFKSICGSAPEKLRQFLLVELIGIDPDTAAPRLVQYTTILKPFCRSLLVRAPLSFNRFTAWRGCGVHAIGCELSHRGGPNSEVQDDLKRFAQGANAARIRSYVARAQTPATAASAARAGFDYVSGEGVGVTDERPGHLYRLALDDLRVEAGADI